MSKQVPCFGDPANCSRPEGECPCLYGTPFDKLDAATQSKLVDYVRDLGEGPAELSTTEFQAQCVLRALNEAELHIWLHDAGKRAPWRVPTGERT